MNPSEPTDPGSVVLRRPHYRRVGEGLHFLISQRPVAGLSPLQRQVWDALGEQTTLQSLRGRFGRQVDEAVHRLVELGACDIAPGRFPANRRKVLIVEPHSDDAVLSVGGTMLARCGECEFTIATLASRSNYTLHFLDGSWLDVEAISSLRAAEGRLAARVVGGHHRAVGLDEALVRYHDGAWSPELVRLHRASLRAAMYRSYPQACLASWTGAVRRLLGACEAEEAWLPLGVGRHCDHQLARDACLNALLEEPRLAVGRTIRLYQEVPYGLHDPAYNRMLPEALQRAGARLTQEVVSIDDVWERKLRLVSLYASQFGREDVDPAIEESARATGGASGLAESMWRMDRLPKRLAWSDLRGHDGMSKERRARVEDWWREHGRARRIRLLLRAPMGRWSYDARELLEGFPDASFEVHVSSAGVAELRDVASRRFHVHEVRAGAGRWLALALRLAVSRPAPTVFISGRRRMRAARFLAGLWPLSDTLVLVSMDHFLSAVRGPDPA
jgi:LmbE family N-acetylglucosaminyl deacetylase